MAAVLPVLELRLLTRYVGAAHIGLSLIGDRGRSVIDRPVIAAGASLDRTTSPNGATPARANAVAANSLRHFARTFFTALLLVASLFVATPIAFAQTTSGNATTGGTLYNAYCDTCHGATVGSSYPPIKNAANAGGVIATVIGAGMAYATETTCDGGGDVGGTKFCQTELNDIAAYISQQVSQTLPSAAAVAHNSGGTLINMVNIFANTLYGPVTKGIYSSGVSRGTVTYSTSGSTIRATYTPTTGQCGTDTGIT